MCNNNSILLSQLIAFVAALLRLPRVFQSRQWYFPLISTVGELSQFIDEVVYSGLCIFLRTTTMAVDNLALKSREMGSIPRKLN